MIIYLVNKVQKSAPPLGEKKFPLGKKSPLKLMLLAHFFGPISLHFPNFRSIFTLVHKSSAPRAYFYGGSNSKVKIGGGKKLEEFVLNLPVTTRGLNPIY